MSTRTVVDCDRCTAPASPTESSLSVAIEKYLDAAGSLDFLTVDFHLCSKCMWQVLRKALAQYDMKGEKAINMLKFLTGIPNLRSL